MSIDIDPFRSETNMSQPTYLTTRKHAIAFEFERLFFLDSRNTK